MTQQAIFTAIRSSTTAETLSFRIGWGAINRCVGWWKSTFDALPMQNENRDASAHFDNVISSKSIIANEVIRQPSPSPPTQFIVLPSNSLCMTISKKKTLKAWKSFRQTEKKALNNGTASWNSPLLASTGLLCAIIYQIHLLVRSSFSSIVSYEKMLLI